jgi:hypothetical protein
MEGVLYEGMNAKGPNPIEPVLRPVSLIETLETRQVWKEEKDFMYKPTGQG